MPTRQTQNTFTLNFRLLLLTLLLEFLVFYFIYYSVLIFGQVSLDEAILGFLPLEIFLVF